MAFIAALVVVKPFLGVVRRVGFVPFAWYRGLPPARVLLRWPPGCCRRRDAVVAAQLHRRVLRHGAARHQRRRVRLDLPADRRLRRSVLRRLAQRLRDRRRCIPGLGILTTALVVLLVGALATNVIGKRVLQRAEGYLLRVPVFRTIYAPVKQLVVAFSPDNEYGFKRVVLVEDSARGFLLGFLTKEFTVDRGLGPQAP